MKKIIITFFSFAHGQNNYLYVSNNQISNAYYNEKALGIEITEYVLNGENEIMSLDK